VAKGVRRETAHPPIFTASRRSDLQAQYQAVVDYALQHRDSQIGLLMDRNDWEYPLWRGLRRSGIAQLRIEHVGIPDFSCRSPIPSAPSTPAWSSPR
jgi:hypothetical protein